MDGRLPTFAHLLGRSARDGAFILCWALIQTALGLLSRRLVLDGFDEGLLWIIRGIFAATTLIPLLYKTILDAVALHHAFLRETQALSRSAKSPEDRKP